ncbi:MAG: CHAT domain-containing protein [Cyanobacteria bacterium P01_G01_bin.54]
MPGIGLVRPIAYGVAIAVLYSLTSLPAFAFTPSLTAAPDGTGTLITIEGSTYHIQGGTQAGANLFHSFQALGLKPGEMANFLSHPGIHNILGRVTGGDPSIINGLIKVTGANSNLYLMNPAGMVFGADASLNVGGDFVATTADRIAVGEGWFISSGTNDYATLVGAPHQFAFASEQPGAVLNFGDLSNERDVSLIGGTVVNDGKVVSTAGTVTIAAVPGERLVNLSQPGMLLSLDVPTDALAAGIRPVDLPTLLTGSGRGNPPMVAPDSAGVGTGALPLQNFQGDVVIAGAVQAATVYLYAAGQVKPTDPHGIQGDTRVIRFSETGDNPDQAVFIDRRADHPEDLLYGATAGTIAQIIESDEDGIAVISEQLAVISESVGALASVAIVAEGNAGNFWLGSEWIRAETIGNYATQLQSWGEALTANADLLIYSCFTALGETGEALVQHLADWTGADVAASIDATGSANYGANWQLEYSTLSGSIEAENPFTHETVANWNGKLATYTVTDFTDGGGVNTLRSLVGTAASGDTVIFAAPSTVTLTMGDIFVNTNLTIDGNGGIVDGNNSSRIFNIPAAMATNVTIQNMTIRNGTTASDGGGVYSRDSNLTLINATVSGNSASNDGGGVFNYDGTITINNSVVFGNSSGDDGGGVQTYNGNITISNSVVSGNSSGDDGGGVQSYNGNITINNSMISSNSSGDDGGGVESDFSSVFLFDSTVSGNSSLNGGGGVDGNSVTLNNSTVSSNSTAGVGGGIYSFLGVNLTNSTVANNIANTQGGGLFANSLVTTINSTVSGNSAGNNGGGIYTMGAVTTSGATIFGNTSGTQGGGVWSGGNTTITNTTIANNAAVTNGGGIYTNGANITLNLTNSVIQNNSTSAGNDGGVAGFVGTSGVVTLDSSIIVDNSASNSTGGLFSQGNLILRNSSIYRNTGGNQAGGIALSPNTVASLTNSTVSSNSGGINGGGGILGASGMLLNLTNSTIAFNTTSGDGGGIRTTTDASHTIVNTIIANNGDTGSHAPDLSGNFASASFRHSLIRSNAGITAGAPIDGVNGNIIGKDPLLGPLQNNGGSTPTHVLLAGSPAIDAGDNSVLSLSLDQRGQIRIFNGTVDMGAFESQTVITVVPPDFDLNTPNRLNAVEQIDVETVRRDRVAELLAEGLICQAAVTLDQYHSQTFAQQLDRPPTKNTPSCIELQQQLDPGTALVYVFAQADHLHLIALTADADPSHQETPLARETVLAELRHFQQELTDPVRRLSQRYLAPAQRLHQWIVQPLLPELEARGIDNILFGLDDGLRTLPIAALHDGEQFLLEQYQVTLIPSFALTPTHRPRLADAAVFSVGISAFEGLAPLPAVPLELARIERQFPVGMSLKNNQATLASFQAQLHAQSHPIVHLATHGNFQPGGAERSYIQFWDQPLTLAQLEAVEGSLAAVELLVLSACRTALGNTTWEYGFAGLAVQAEAGAAVAGLWLVNDVATLALMDEFYRQLSLGQPKGEALRLAQLALLRGTVRLENQQLVGVEETVALPQNVTQMGDRTFWHPYYWSGFTLIGNPW